jgi:hypothetical protein
VGVDVDLTQATSGKRPAADDDAFEGRWGVIFTADTNLVTLPPQPVRTALLIIKFTPSGSRTVLSRDTSATTTKTAYRIVVEEII